ncbi:MAG: NAD(P) transhydrogenase subunit alpha [Acidimicrobiales bacterium]
MEPVTTLAVIKELRSGERRVAMVPAEAARLAASGVKISFEAGAGLAAGYDDASFAELDGVTVTDAATALATSDIVAAIGPPTPGDVDRLPRGKSWIGFLPPWGTPESVARLAARNITAFSFDLMPRTSRAQSMDALTSQSSLAGYQAAVLAAERLGRAFPMMMTAAGTIPPARVLVIGAGVAGLQAIATARRLGAVVRAHDVRPQAAEEVRSLGATFVELGLVPQVGGGGYAAEQDDEVLARQQAALADIVAGSDVVITTAAIPGRPAPRILTTAMVERMRQGSLVIDLAAAGGGNCELTIDGQTRDHGGVTVIGAADLASRVATTASALYARNVASLAALLLGDGGGAPDFDDDILSATCVTANGVVRYAGDSEPLVEAPR